MGTIKLNKKGYSNESRVFEFFETPNDPKTILECVHYLQLDRLYVDKLVKKWLKNGTINDFRMWGNDRPSVIEGDEQAVFYSTFHLLGRKFPSFEEYLKQNPK